MMIFVLVIRAASFPAISIENSTYGKTIKYQLPCTFFKTTILGLIKLLRWCIRRIDKIHETGENQNTKEKREFKLYFHAIQHDTGKFNTT